MDDQTKIMEVRTKMMDEQTKMMDKWTKKDGGTNKNGRTDKLSN